MSIRGVGIYVSEKFHFYKVEFDSNCVEHLWIKITLKGLHSLLVGCIYRSPSSNPHHSTSELCDLLTSLNGYSHILICGNFNYPNINWSSLSCTTSYSQDFLDSIHDSYLFQHVTEPTHYRPNTIANILDLVLTNEEAMINNIQYLPGIGLAPVITFVFSFIYFVIPLALKLVYLDIVCVKLILTS